MKITEKLGTDLQKALKNADEIWIAVALITNAGLDQIQTAIPESCIQHYLLGVDLPTSPKVLEHLYKQELLDSKVKVLMYLEQDEFYHPKVYLIRNGKKYSAFVGSANCTGGGLLKNIEISIYTEDAKQCKSLLKWIDTIADHSSRLTKDFIDSYKKDYAERTAWKKANARRTRGVKKKGKAEGEVFIENRDSLLELLKEYRADKKEYNHWKKDRAERVKEYREALDYPNFKTIDLDFLYSEGDLGYIIPITKPQVKREMPRLKKMVKMLTDESIDIATRYEEAIKGDYKVDGIGKALISKVLVVHRPELYCLLNSKSEATLKNHGIEYPRGMSKGERYKALCKYLIELCNQAKIENLAVLDYYLYIEA